ncbi:alpha/beta fold hydrolase [Marinomonas primoryensis]|uniref:2-hydroxymuconic semialdehyde hydrolase n=1 Tax=Marinomonas primoryensis TaxID=178399 RepID=A0A859CZ73_9GAMM|nr:alpha/beta hydrolase [Marinomonas primoryensis]QKK81887.1 2-hydroxymuconic semialdehyde hydrolase [Marinomonas primoryensis]
MKELDRKFVLASNHKTAYFECGDGEPLLLLHGSGPGVSGWTNWNGVLDELGESYHVFVPDIAGFGFTEFREGTEYDIKFWVNHLVEFMDAVGIKQASLIGNSFGGAVGIGLALFAPDRLKKLILLGTPAGTFMQTAGLAGAWRYEPSESNMRALMELFPYNKALITDELVTSRYEASARAGSQEALRKLLPKPNDEGETLVKGFPVGALQKITAPTLVLHGREDRVVPLECGLRLVEYIPNADLFIFGQCGHWVQTEQRQKFLNTVNAFID